MQVKGMLTFTHTYYTQLLTIISAVSRVRVAPVIDKVYIKLSEYVHNKLVIQSYEKFNTCTNIPNAERMRAAASIIVRVSEMNSSRPRIRAALD